MTVGVVGISFRTAPVDLRERAAVRPADVPERLRRIRSEFPASELVLISTCNRTELYTDGIDVVAEKARLVRHLVAAGGPESAGSVEPQFYVKTGREAAEHLFAVAASLDAMVVGETEILGQVRQALALAEAAQAVGQALHPVFQNAFKVARRVHSETDICRGRVSVSSLAVEFAERVFERLGAKTVMLVGAGDTAELALKSLIDRGARDVMVLNRSPERGQALAAKCGGRALPFDLLDDYLARADIVISSTSAPHFVIRTGPVRRAVEARRGRPMLLIDIALPRDIEPEAGQLKNVYLYGLDDLQRIAAENLAKRQKAVDRAWRIVREGIDESVRPNDDGVRQMLRKFDERGHEICEDALQRAFAREKLAALPEPCRDEIRTLAGRIVNKFLAEPREAVKRAARNGDWEEYARVVDQLFGFDRKENPAGEHDESAPPGAGEESGKKP